MISCDLQFCAHCLPAATRPAPPASRQLYVSLRCPTAAAGASCISIYLPIFNCQRTLTVAKTNAEPNRSDCAHRSSARRRPRRSRGVSLLDRCGNWSNQKGLAAYFGSAVPGRRGGGGAGRDRTDDPLLAKQVLSQLSYSPNSSHTVVGLGRLELPTSRLSGVRSNQLSYRPS